MRYTGSMATTKTTHKPFVLVELSSDSVGVGCGVLSSSASELVWCTRLLFKGQVSREYEILERVAISALLEGSMQLAGEGVKELVKKGVSFAHAQVVFAYATPWSVGLISTLRKTSNNPRTVSEKEFKDSIVKEEYVFQQSDIVRTHIERTGPVSLLETRIVDTRANGYRLQHAHSFPTSSFEATMYYSAIPKTLRARCDEVAKKTFHGIGLEHVSATYLLSLAQQVAHPDIERCLLVEVGSEMTVVSYMWGGVLENTTWFLSGSRGLTEEVAKRARSAEEVRSAVELAFTTPSEVVPYSTWITAFQDALVDVLGGIAPPSHAYLLVSEDMEIAFTRLIKIGLDAVSPHPINLTLLQSLIRTKVCEPQAEGAMASPQPFACCFDRVLSALAMGIVRL